MIAGLEVLVAVKRELLRTPYANETPQKTHVKVRCPVCGDSPKHHDSTHCYINIEGNKPVSYYCHQCNNGGFLNSTHLRSLGITNLDVLTGVRKYNNEFRKLLGLSSENWRKAKHDIIYGSARSYVPEYRQRSDHEFKLRYIEERLGIELGYDDIPKLKIVLSLRDFLKYNTLKLHPSMYSVAKLIENNYVGFLSMRGDYIIFRNTQKDKNMRYINYPIFSSREDMTKSFIIPTEVDLMQNDITFEVTEGVFDILGCYFNINNRRTENTIYGAVCGAGFKGFISSILHLGFIDNLNINIYSDRDKSKYYYRSVLELKDQYKSLSILYNQYGNEKDIGVPKDRIDVRKIKLIERGRYK